MQGICARETLSSNPPTLAQCHYLLNTQTTVTCGALHTPAQADDRPPRSCNPVSLLTVRVVNSNPSLRFPNAARRFSL